MILNVSIREVQDGWAATVIEPADEARPGRWRMAFDSRVCLTPADALEEAKDFCAWADADYRVIDEESMVASGDF